MPKKGASYTEIFLKILAWICVIKGALGVMSSVGFTLMSLFMPFDQLNSNMPGMAPDAGARMAKVMIFERNLLLILLPLTIAELTAGIGILRRRHWGWSLMHGTAWAYIGISLIWACLALFFLDFSTLFPMPAMMANSKVDPAVQAKAMSTLYQTMKWMSLAFSVLWCAIASVIIWFLRRKETRAWFPKS